MSLDMIYFNNKGLSNSQYKGTIREILRVIQGRMKEKLEGLSQVKIKW